MIKEKIFGTLENLKEIELKEETKSFGNGNITPHQEYILRACHGFLLEKVTGKLGVHVLPEIGLKNLNKSLRLEKNYTPDVVAFDKENNIIRMVMEVENPKIHPDTEKKLVDILKNVPTAEVFLLTILPGGFDLRKCGLQDGNLVCYDDVIFDYLKLDLKKLIENTEI